MGDGLVKLGVRAPVKSSAAVSSRPREKGTRGVQRILEGEAGDVRVARNATPTNDDLGEVRPVGKIVDGNGGRWLYDERGLYFRRRPDGKAWECQRFGPRAVYNSLSKADRKRVSDARRRERVRRRREEKS